LAAKPFELSSLPFDFSLVGIDLPLLIRLLNLLSLELIADERAGTQPECAADGGACARMAHSSADEASRSRTAQSANTCALFPCGQIPPGAAS
jgi:hypothetical protein